MSRRFCLLLVCASLFAALIAACSPPVIAPAPTATLAPTAGAVAPTAAPTRVSAAQVYHHDAADVSLLLPTDWAVSRREGPTLPKEEPWAEAYSLCPVTQPECGGFLIVADAERVTPQEALRRLCAGGCDGSPEPQPVTLASGAELARYAFPTVDAAVEGDPAREWFVTVHESALLVLSIVDPETGSTRDDVLGTLAFGPEPYSEAAAAAALQAARLPGPDRTGGLVTDWERVEIGAAGLIVEVPAGWQRQGQGYRWSEPNGQALRLGIDWHAPVPGREHTPVVPTEAVVIGSAPLELIWGDATIYTVKVTPLDGAPEAMEEHIIVLTGDRVYDFHASAPDPEAMNGLREALVHVLRTARFGRETAI